MTTKAPLVILALIAAASLPSVGRAQDEAAAPAARPPGRVLKSDSLEEFLDNLGYDVKKPKATPENPNPAAVLKISRAAYTFNVNVYIIPSGQIIWLFIPLEKPSDPAKLDSGLLLQMLAKNDVLGPTHFSYNAKNQLFYLNRALDNHDITPKLIHTEVENLVLNAEQTSNLWDINKVNSTPTEPPK